MEKIISASEEGTKLLSYLKYKLGLSRGEITELKKLPTGITVNGLHVTVRAILHEGDILRLETEDASDDINENIVPAELPVDIIYEDASVIAVNKPSGMPTHPSHNHFDDTLANALAFIFRKRSIPFVFRAVNRLDRDTSGVVLVAKNRASAYSLSKQIAEGSTEKEYIAVCRGEIKQGGAVRASIKRKTESIIERTVCKDGEGQFAITEYEPLSYGGENTVVKLRLLTGRTHQIRVHMAYIGHSVVGDSLYGSESDKISRQALHCRRIIFVSPETEKRISVCAPLFDDMKLLASESGYIETEETDNG